MIFNKNDIMNRTLPIKIGYIIKNDNNKNNSKLFLLSIGKQNQKFF